MADLLTEYLMASTATKFHYGQHDCATFCLGWADRLTGRDGVQQWLGRYSDEASCKAFIEEGCGMAAIADDFLHSVYGMVHAAQVSIGNIVLASAGNALAFGIRCESDKVIFRMERGLFATRRAKPVHEWGLPCPRS